MALPNSPNTITAAMINKELGRAENAPFNLNDSAVRALAGKPSGTISFSDFWGKANKVTVVYNTKGWGPRGNFFDCNTATSGVPSELPSFRNGTASQNGSNTVFRITLNSSITNRSYTVKLVGSFVGDMGTYNATIENYNDLVITTSNHTLFNEVGRECWNGNAEIRIEVTFTP